MEIVLLSLLSVTGPSVLLLTMHYFSLNRMFSPQYLDYGGLHSTVSKFKVTEMLLSAPNLIF